MPIAPEELKNLISQAMPEAEVILRDLAGDNDHYEVTVVSPAFQGKSRLEQHRMVQKTVKGRDIHALAIKTSVK